MSLGHVEWGTLSTGGQRVGEAAFVRACGAEVDPLL